MLLTTCPNCSAQFKVQPEQLNVRQGRVMCGRCRQVFNAFQSLTRISDDEVTASQAAPPPPEEIAAEASAAGALFLREEPMPALPPHRMPAATAEKEFYVPQPDEQAPGEEAVGEPAANLSAPDPQLKPSDVVLDDLETDDPTPSRLVLDDTPLVVDPANPLLSAAGSRKERPAHSRSWALGALLLIIVLAAQGAYAFRSALVQSYPPLRSVFVSTCEWAGCSLSWSRDESVLRIEASDLIESPGKAGRIQLTATLVNRGTIAQDYPALELKLTDNANQVQLSRILLPQDYLGRVPGKDEGLQPNAETFVNLNVEVTNRVQASGYGVRAFYP